MNSLTKIFWVILLILPAQHSLAEDLERLNFIYIMADELGYAELGLRVGWRPNTSPRSNGLRRDEILTALSRAALQHAAHL